ncbi:MAG: NAD-dependent epimerase/dehydratase family protein [Phycisphaeraceae bacterium]
MAGKAIITGGAGFIGSHLAEHLLAEGRSLRIIDDLSTGSADNLQHLLGPDCDLIEGLAGRVMASTPSLWQGVDAVFHLAASVGVQRVLEDPTSMIRNNIDETAIVVDAAVEHHATLLIASSSEVYGRSNDLPLREDGDLVYGPTTSSRWAYGMAKALDEHLVLDAVRRRGLRAVIARLFNTIGPRQVGHYGMVVPRFVARAVGGQPLEVYGDGTQTRAFCDVRDVTRAMSQLVSKPDTHGRAYNLGSEQQLTISDLAKRVIERAGTTSELILKPYDEVYPPGFEETPDRAPSIDRLRAAIGFEPMISLEQTLDELIEIARQDKVTATSMEKRT